LICVLIIINIVPSLDRYPKVVEASAPLIKYHDIAVPAYKITNWDVYNNGNPLGTTTGIQTYPYVMQNIQYNPATKVFSYSLSEDILGRVYTDAGNVYGTIQATIRQNSTNVGYSYISSKVTVMQSPYYLTSVNIKRQNISVTTWANLPPAEIYLSVGFNDTNSNQQGYTGGNFPLVVSSEAPTMDLTTLDNQIVANEVGLNKYKIEGYVRDGNNDTLDIAVDIAGVTHSTTVTNTKVAKYFEVNYDVISDQIPNGTHTVTVTADDGTGGMVTKKLSLIVKSRASNNLFITLNDIVYYETIYNDPELDIQSDERWKFVHDQSYFENPMGTIPDHQAWRSSPYMQFSKTGHYVITFQDNDTIPIFSEYQTWSLDSFDKINLYVHRKPIPRFTVDVYSNGSGGFPTIINDTSYDLDKRSLNEGIADTEWNWKDSTATVWVSGLPPVNLTIDHTYEVKLRVKDHQGLWSAPLIKTFSTTGAPILTNKPPVATMTIPAGTQVNPTMFTTQKPTFSWNQTDPDAVTVFKAFEIQVTNEANTATVINSGILAQNTSATTKNWTATSDLPAGQKLRVRVRVNDGLLWSAWSTQTWMIINRPPVANFDWSPKPVWEGDTVTLTNQSSDPDGDSLTYSWIITGPGGYQQTATTTHVTCKLLQPGDYAVTLTASDGKVLTNVTRTLRVESLQLEANVSYTDLWLEHHLQMGHETVQNPKSFYTGEIFVVSAVGSLAATSRVTASLDAIGRDGNPISIAVDLDVTNPANHYLGSLYDPILSSLTGGLPEGLYQIKFKMTYTNGVMKEVSIPIQIIGHVQGVVNVHRRQ
jgi:hypothetical protein